MKITLKGFCDLLESPYICISVWDGCRWFECTGDTVPADLLDREISSIDVGSDGLVLYLVEED